MRSDAQRNRSAILAAAERAFAEQGAQATTEQVAQAAGVAVGTVFRHFPTKDDLWTAVLKQSLQRLVDLAGTTTLFSFFTAVVTEAVETRTVVEALAHRGVDVAEALAGLTSAVAGLLSKAQQSGDVRPGIQVDEVMALLTATALAAQSAGWPDDLRERTLRIIYAGLH